MTMVHGCSGCATSAGVMGCPTHGSMALPGVGVAMQVQAFNDGAQLCALGHHAWMPWLPITTDDGLVTHYVTFCVRCRHHEQYDL